MLGDSRSCQFESNLAKFEIQLKYGAVPRL